MDFTLVIGGPDTAVVGGVSLAWVHLRRTTVGIEVSTVFQVAPYGLLKHGDRPLFVPHFFMQTLEDLSGCGTFKRPQKVEER